MDPNTTETAIQATRTVLVAVPVVQLARHFLENIADPLTKEIGETLRDHYREWKAPNVQAAAQKAAAKLKTRGIERDVPKAFLLPALDRAGDVDAPELQELWAELIANGVAGEENQQPRYIQTLAGLSAEDAKVFENYVRADAAGLFVRRGKVGGSWWEQNPTGERLRSLGLLEVAGNKPEPQLAQDAAGNVKVMSLGHVDYPLRVSNYGHQFARAVGIVAS